MRLDEKPNEFLFMMVYRFLVDSLFLILYGMIRLIPQRAILDITIMF